MTSIPDHSKVASNVCIYWKTVERGATPPGQCTATNYFQAASISCYNGGLCNNSGTCRYCTAYDVPHLKFSQKDTRHVYTETFLMEWNDTLKKYIPVRRLNPDETGKVDTTQVGELTESQKISTFNMSGLQTPFNLQVYNMRPKVKQCCNWYGAPSIFSKDRANNLYITYYTSTGAVTSQYLTQVEADDPDTGGKVTRLTPTSAVASANSCVLYRPEEGVSTSYEWVYPLTASNPTAYGCNGCKPECPYYTGPKWTYCVDSKLEMGDKITAAQVQELRFYSDDWKSMDTPELVWKKRFKDPVLWAWSGGFEGKSSSDTIYPTDAPTVKKVYIKDFRSETPDIVIDPVVAVDAGLVYRGQYSLEGEILETTNYPTLIKEIGAINNSLSVVWPPSTLDKPFVFKTFRVGQNRIQIFIQTVRSTSVYAINITKHPQGLLSDEVFIETALRDFPEDVVLATMLGNFVTASVELEYKPEVNVIKVFTRNPGYTRDTSTTEAAAEPTSQPTPPGNTDYDNNPAYLTAFCHVYHKFYHAVLAQTVGKDVAGNKQLQPWIERFERVECEADIMYMTGSLDVHQILWDSPGAGRYPWYAVEEVISEEPQTDWITLGCSHAAVTFANVKCNSVTPWSVSGTSKQGVPLGIFLNRDNNDSASETGLVPLRIVAQSLDGSGMPSNVVIVTTYSKLSSPMDAYKDVIVATYSTTEYKQAPVRAEDIPKLKNPELKDMYISELPVSIDINSARTSFKVEGSFLNIYQAPTIGDMSSYKYDRIYSIDDVKKYIHDSLVWDEGRAVSSFSKGGVEDGGIRASGEIFNIAKENFESKYHGWFFLSDNAPVTLSEVCKRLNYLRFHEGSYSFLVMFKDEDGRPIGVRRIHMLLQSSFVETRDVEIYYEWEKDLYAWPISDSWSLLAVNCKPMQRSPDKAGVENYRPRCGDHSEWFLSEHFFGDPGPMWYPYISCLTPQYHETDQNIYVKCNNTVEGFGDAYDGKRWDYWERMRGPDRMVTWISSQILVLGCFYNETSETYTTENEQRFLGYTRIRSYHPHGPYSKDREALHINRHFLKRNLKVRNELVQSPDDTNRAVWTDEFTQLLFVPNTTVERVGSQAEAPIWVHLSDNISTVSRTTPDAQHPFTHLLLKRVGDFYVNETFDVGRRYTLAELLDDRDLTSTQNRNTNGTLVYTPGDAVLTEGKENYSDLIPVYKDQKTVWAWKEMERKPVRGTPRITGIDLYNPSVNIWKKDKTSAVFTEEGAHKLEYLAPLFDPTTGVVVQPPSVSWNGGPKRIINWYTGEWVTPGTIYDYSTFASNSKIKNFRLFGRDAISGTTPGTGSVVSQGSCFLIDGSQMHKYVLSISPSGVEEYGNTCRGLGVNPLVSPSELPYDNVDFMVENAGDVSTLLETTNALLEQGKPANLTIPLNGFKYVDYVEISCSFGVGKDTRGNSRRYDVPETVVSIILDSTVSVLGGSGVVIEELGRSSYKFTTESAVVESATEDGAVYVNRGEGVRLTRYICGARGDKLRISFGECRVDGLARVDSIKLMYRKPVDRSESVYTYDVKFNVSTGDTGYPDYRKMLYYYSRTIPSYSDNFSGKVFGPGGLKWTNRSVKDVVLEYEYYDLTGTRFRYKNSVLPRNNPDVAFDGNTYSINGPIRICTKGRTLFATDHVDDCPRWVSTGGRTVENRNNKASNDKSSCATRVGTHVLNEEAQECLYNEAKQLSGGDLTAEYEWFWHPDEVDFWENTLGISLDRHYRTLELITTIPPLNQIMENYDFGCEASKATPYQDGYVHPINKWYALGHRHYSGSPSFNPACYDVVVRKQSDHIGERLYGTPEYTTMAEAISWPELNARDKYFYLSNGPIDKADSYMGGIISGAGILGMVNNAMLGSGLTEPQQAIEREVIENTMSTRADAGRADATKREFHTDRYT